jgi:fumarylacetoacetase
VTARLDGTHDPRLRSWLEAAEAPDADFPIQNLPYGVFRRHAAAPRIGVAIGDQVLDLAACRERGLLEGLPAAVESACAEPVLNDLMGRPAPERAALRRRLSDLLRAEGATISARRMAALVLVPQAEAELLLPAAVGDYTDFYASIHHATNVGRMMRPDNPLLPNYKWVPIGYHGRASSIVVSGTPVARPSGQLEAGGVPSFGPSQGLDYELEVGAFVGPGNARGAPIPIAEAEDHLFGLCLVNDWSARDVQRWEYQPLGPFLSKSFATSVSPWVVTLEALAPFRVARFTRPAGDPQPLPYLRSDEDARSGAFDLRLEVQLSSRRMREQGLPPFRVSASNPKDLYWTPAQMLTHHASNGCNLRPGDLIATGTVSGEAPEARGCLLERTWRGAEPILLPSGEERRFLEDGDEVIMSGHCERDGFRRIGFGICRGEVRG